MKPRKFIVTNARGWFSADQKLPPHQGEEVLMWYPEAGRRIHSAHARPPALTSAAIYERPRRYAAKDLRWMPLGIRVEGTFWKKMPKPPSFEEDGGEC